MIEEIRKRIKARRTDGSDAYENGQNVAYSDVLQIIDEVKKEHPVPEDIQEAALLAYPVKEKLNYKGSGKYDKNFQRRGAYAAGMLAERERLASCPTIKGWVARDKCGELYFYTEKPQRCSTMWRTESFCAFMPFPQRNLTSLRWENDPIEVEIIIKEVEK